MRLFDRLIRKIFRSAAVESAPPPPAGQPWHNPVAIPMPEGVDPRAFDRVPDKLWRTDPSEAARQTREKRAELFRFNRERAEYAGCTRYIWRSAGDSDVCQVCASRNGKRFHYAKEPPNGHAGICTACPQGYCRCYDEPIVPGD